LETSVPQFGLEDVKAVADLIEVKYIKSNRERLSFFINGKKLELKQLPAGILPQLLAALKSELPTADIHSLEVYYKK